MQLTPVLALGLLLASAGPALAASPSDRAENRFETRLARQDDRIDRGVEAGRIGGREAQALGRQQTALDRAVDRQAADGGRLTAREAYRLENRFDRGSRAIRLATARPRG
jgi:hypothetical protein